MPVRSHLILIHEASNVPAFAIRIEYNLSDLRLFDFQLREATNRVEELETSNKHLETRLGKLKTAKSNLLKEL